MILNTQDRRLTTDGIHMDYVVFGEGEEILVVLPGLGDGLKTSQGISKPLAYRYRKYAKHFKVYLFSRRLRMPKGMDVQAMAEDQLKVLKRLKIRNYNLLGCGLGSFIAQELALIDYEAINKIIFAQCAFKPSKELKDKIKHWNELAKDDDFEALATELIKERYGELKVTKPLVRAFQKIKKPMDFTRFMIQARAMSLFKGSDDLGKLFQHVLILNGTEDELITLKDAMELKEHLRDAEIKLIEGDAVQLKAGMKEFDRVALEFLGVEEKEKK